MEKILDVLKNKKYLFLYLLGVLLLSSGVSFAYYSANTNSNGDTNSISDITNDVKSGSVSAEEKVSMNNKNLYPGHKEIVSVKVTGTGDKIVLFNLIYEGINTFNTELNYKVYKTNEEVDIKYNCEKKIRVENGAQILREECNATNISELGSVITSGTLNKSETASKQVLLSEQAIETSERGTVEYYYVEIIYPNLNSNQNSDLNSNIQGKITVESSKKEYISPSLVYTASTVSGENEWYKSVDITGTLEGTSETYTGTYCIGNTICIPTENLTITNKSFNIEMPSNANSQVLCTNITDKYGISVSSCTESYKVDGEVPRGSISIENETVGSNGWYKVLTLKITGEDNNSRVSSIKHCTTTSTTCIPSTTVNGTSTSVVIPNNALEQKVCYQIKDNAGNESVVQCSSSYKVDGEIPTITIGTTSSTTNSVTLNVSGSDTHSKIDKYYYKIEGGQYSNTTSSTITINNLNQGTSYKVYVYGTDKAGNRSTEKTVTITTKEVLTVAQVLNKYTKNTSRSGTITAPFTSSTPTTVYSAADDNGISYVFAGVNPNNWVKIGYIYFRIIRFNGDGTMRLIYSGEGSPATTGYKTQIGTKAFNERYNNNMYVGLQYTSGNVHGTGTNSTILGTSTSTDATTLYGWYNSKIKEKYASLIDTNAGFCSDRDNYTNDTGTTAGGGTGTTKTYYGGYTRYVKGGSWQTSYTPTLRCKNASDNLKLPVGLITADEYALAGGAVNGTTTTFWLHTGEDYWTMSPCYYNSSALVFYAYSAGYLNGWDVNSAYGVRPVINLKASTTFAAGNGTSSNPYVVQV